MPPPIEIWRRSDGQAATELVALLPVLLGLLACVWQAVLAGHASLAAGTAARAAARAQAIGLDAPAAARAHLPRVLEHGLRVDTHADGAVTVTVRIPTLPGVPDLGRTRATARFEAQQ
jgi:Flp pilus assembly protein TadG